MTFLHFLNCALLTYAPTVVIDRSTVVYVWVCHAAVCWPRAVVVARPHPMCPLPRAPTCVFRADESRIRLYMWCLIVYIGCQLAKVRCGHSSGRPLARVVLSCPPCRSRGLVVALLDQMVLATTFLPLPPANAGFVLTRVRALPSSAPAGHVTSLTSLPVC